MTTVMSFARLMVLVLVTTFSAIGNCTGNKVFHHFLRIA